MNKDWFAYLLDEPNTNFRIRIRATDKLNDGWQGFEASVVLQDLQVGQTKVLQHPH